MSARGLLAALQRDALAALGIIRADGGRATVPGATDAATRAAEEDCEFVAALAASLQTRFGRLPEKERLFLERHPDLVQLSFHLQEEVKRFREEGDARALVAAVGFLHRHADRLHSEYGPLGPPRVPLTDKVLLGLLAQYTDSVWRRRFAEHPAVAGSGRPFVDKLFRDYRLSGFPGHVLAAASRISETEKFDLQICILRGGLPYALLFELLTGRTGATRHVACVRRGGSRFSPDLVVSPVDFSPLEIRGARVLLVDNNVLSGATLHAVVGTLAVAEPASVCVFVDYVVDPGTGGRRVELGKGTPAGVKIVVAAAESPEGPHQTALKRRLVAELARRLSRVWAPS